MGDVFVGIDKVQAANKRRERTCRKQLLRTAADIDDARMRTASKDRQALTSGSGSQSPEPLHWKWLPKATLEASPRNFAA
jgi:hypothetical protein